MLPIENRIELALTIQSESADMLSALGFRATQYAGRTVNTGMDRSHKAGCKPALWQLAVHPLFELVRVGDRRAPTFNQAKGAGL